jgi:oligopeptide transport system permease protein
LILTKKIVKSVITWLIASLFIIVIILMPRDVTYDATEAGVFQDAHYVYSFEKHMQSFKDFFTFIKENKSLGNYNSYYTIEDILVESIPKSFIIVLLALLLGFIFGLLKGMLDYRLSISRWTIFGKGSTWFFLSIPDFFIVISLQLGLMFLFDIGLFPYVDVFGSDKVDNFIMAIIYLMIYPLFYIAKVVSTCFEAEERKDYIRTARSKGISYNKILYLHVLWNCWITILTNLSTISLYMLSNLFIIEKFMGYKGAGYYFFSAVTPGAMVYVGGGRDLGLANMAIAFTLIFTLFILIVHIISHISIYILDKKRMGESA